MFCNIEKYLRVFCQTFEIDEDAAQKAEFKKIYAWDSVGHMGLISAIEEAFDIMMEPDDIIDLSSFAKGKEILSTKYHIEF